MSAPANDTADFSSPAEPAGIDGTVFLFISLYSLMLAFFIVLYTTAEISAHKAEAAKSSVQDSFKGKPAAIPTEKTAKAAPMGAEIHLRPYYADVKKIARELLEIEEAGIIEEGDTLILRVPTHLLFSPGASLVDDRKHFIQNMVNSLSKSPVGMQIDIEFRLPAALADGALDRLTLLRAGTFARLLVQLGVAEDSIYTGIAEGDSEMVEITFSPRDAATTLLEF